MLLAEALVLPPLPMEPLKRDTQHLPVGAEHSGKAVFLAGKLGDQAVPIAAGHPVRLHDCGVTSTGSAIASR